jgi:predicted transcriptional regulator
MLSIHPKHAQNILDGKKTFEFRRKIPREVISRIYIYATAPVQEVVGYANIAAVLSGKPADMWCLVFKTACITYTEFMRYFENCDRANAFYMHSVHIYQRNDRPPLSAFGLQKPPQSFAYVKVQ